MKINNRLRSMGLIYNEKTEPIIMKEIKYLGYTKMASLLKHHRDIEKIVNLYVGDMRLSLFFWKHIRRIESNLRAEILNYFMNLDFEFIIINAKGKPDKNFLLEFTNYIGDGDGKSSKVYNTLNNIVKKYLLKNQSPKIVDFLNLLSLGQLVDFVKMLSKTKKPEFIFLDKFVAINHLVEIRNKISHFHLLCENFSKEKLLTTWNYILSMSENNDKTQKNKLEFDELIKNYL